MAYKNPQDERLKEARRRHYEKNKDAYIARARAREAEMVSWVKLQKYKPCMDCNEQFQYYLMEFDHRPNEVKVAEIGKMIKRGSWGKLKAEVAKCDVVCVMCHRKRTFKRLGKLDEVILFMD